MISIAIDRLRRPLFFIVCAFFFQRPWPRTNGRSPTLLILVRELVGHGIFRSTDCCWPVILPPTFRLPTRCEYNTEKTIICRTECSLPATLRLALVYKKLLMYVELANAVLIANLGQVDIGPRGLTKTSPPHGPSAKQMGIQISSQICLFARFLYLRFVQEKNRGVLCWWSNRCWSSIILIVGSLYS